MNPEFGFNPEKRRQSFVLNNTELNYIGSIQGDVRAAIDPKKFKDYDQSAVLADIQAVEDTKKKFKDTPEEVERKKLSDATEHLIQDQIETNDWFGPDVIMIASSEYDDIFNGFDAFVEFQDASHLGLALDFTYSAAPEKKFDRIKKEIDRGIPPSAKYFESEHIVGRLKSVARCVIEVDRPVVDEIMAKELRLQHYKSTGDRENIRKVRKDLESHPLQLYLLEQLLYQLKVFKQYAIANGKENFVDLYSLVEKNIQQIYDAKLNWLKQNPQAKTLMDEQRSKMSNLGQESLEKLMADMF
jgi:hypothetical protein